ncbi:hypothetical protein QZM99_00635 [Burkholderia gladioli]|uniref:hypothetical protein n=1 Tax=Burkholderia gladioli TaxID=28095 RepID=UPI002653022C|nr:hypothetical protein [Burkholderia gladioli]MDN7916597.1 hypothetical protein [Burkholderia gladioli]
MTHDQLSNPQRTVMEALRYAGFSVSDVQTLLRAVREPAERSLAAERRERIAVAAFATLQFRPADSTRDSYVNAVIHTAITAVDIADALIARLDK